MPDGVNISLSTRNDVSLTKFSQAPLKTATPFLSGLRNLKYITFMTGSHPIASNEEKDVAELWQRACPSLKTIILPNGVVWFRQGEGISRCPSDV